jgi:hypothetical protein
MSDTPTPSPSRVTTEATPEMTPSHYVAVDVAEANSHYTPDMKRLREVSALVRSLSSNERIAVSREDLLGLLQAVERLQDTLARRILAEWNEREGPDNWPAGQEWHELVNTSHAIFRQLAREESGLNRTPSFREKIDALYRALDVDYETEPLAGWLTPPSEGSADNA